MQHLGTLWNVVNTASHVVEMARASETFRFPMTGTDGATTVYLHTAHAEVRVTRWDEPQVEITAHLQAPFAWRIETDQDDAGVYFVAHRRPVVGTLAGAVFHIHAPRQAYLALKLEEGRLSLDGVTGTYHVPPMNGGELTLTPGQEC